MTSFIAYSLVYDLFQIVLEFFKITFGLVGNIFETVDFIISGDHRDAAVPPQTVTVSG